MPVTLRNTDVLFNDGSSQSAAFNSGTSVVQWGNVASRPTALSQFTNNLGNYGAFFDSLTYDGDGSNYVRGLRRSGNSLIATINCNCVCDCG